MLPHCHVNYFFITVVFFFLSFGPLLIFLIKVLIFSLFFYMCSCQPKTLFLDEIVSIAG